MTDVGNTRWAALRVAVAAVAVAAMCVFVFAMSAEPAEDSDELSLGVAWNIVSVMVPGYTQMPADEQLQWQQALNHPVRKTAHFLEYALLGALMMNLVVQVARMKGSLARERLRFYGVIAWGLTALYAATDELHQMFVAGRSGMVSDVALDSTGALLGVLLCGLICARLARDARCYHSPQSSPGRRRDT